MEVSTRIFVGCDGVRLVADCRGDPARPAVVFAHGGGQTRHAWGGTAEVLSRAGWYTVCYDHRGHGESEWDPSGDYDIDTFSGDLTALLSQVGGRPHVVGASLGGISALVSAGELGADLGSVVLVDVTPRVNPQGVENIQRFMLAHAESGFADLEEAADAVANYTGRPRRADVSGLQKNLRRRNGRWYWHWDPNFMVSNGPRFMPSGRLEQATRNIAAPIMLVRGRASDVVTDEEVEEFLRLVPDAEYVAVDQARHMVAGDRNDAFTMAVAEFLARVGVG